MSEELDPQVPGNEEAQPTPVKAKKPRGLPDQDEVNPDKIPRAVLTQQGWVVPTNYGSKKA